MTVHKILNYRKGSTLSTLRRDSGTESEQQLRLVFSAMKYRTVVMYAEIGCFVACVCGWILVCSTLVIQYWRYSEVGKTVLTNGHTYSNLWKDCLTDSTGMTDCKEFPSLLGLDCKTFLLLLLRQNLIIPSVKVFIRQ